MPTAYCLVVGSFDLFIVKYNILVMFAGCGRGRRSDGTDNRLVRNGRVDDLWPDPRRNSSVQVGLDPII